VNLIEIAKRRYATKKFDSSKRIPDDVFEQIKGLLQFSPSSVNSQPWHFVVADSELGKTQLSKAAQGIYVANESKILDASHVILFCAKTDLSDEYLLHLTEQEEPMDVFQNRQAKRWLIRCVLFMQTYIVKIY